MLHIGSMGCIGKDLWDLAIGIVEGKQDKRWDQE